MTPTIPPSHHPNILFFGSSQYSPIVAKALHDKFKLRAIITNPDKPKGRKKELTPAPPKVFAQKNQIEVLTTDRLDTDFLQVIRDLEPDFIVVCDYGLILPSELLEIPKYASLNVHHSLLPKYRGPTPAPSAILAGEKISGVTIIKMTEKVDAGDIYAQKEYELKPNETTDSLLTELNTIGGQLVCEVVSLLLHPQGESEVSAGEHPGDVPLPQDESQATYTQRMTKADGHLNLLNPPAPRTLQRMIRAYHPWPGVWTNVEVRSKNDEERNMRVKFLPSNFIQPEGKKPMTITEFLNGYPNLKSEIEKLGLN